LVVVVNSNGDEYYCIDTSRTDKNGESPVVVWDVATRSVIATKGRSFGEFLLERLQATAEIIDET
jgi:hypothetical protein